MAETVAYITSHSKPSGATAHAATVMRELNDRDGVELFAVNTQQTGYPETFMAEGDDGVTWVFPNSLTDALTDLAPDTVIVHVYNTHLFETLEDLSEDLDARWVYRHGTNMAEQWMSRAAGRKMALAGLKSIVWDLGWFDVLIAPSQTAAARLNLYYGDDTPLVSVVPNALAIKEFAPTTYFPGDTLKIVLASRTAPINYAALPLLAIRRIVEEHDVSFKMFGGGNPSLTASLKRVAGDADGIEIMGHYPREVVIKHLEQADVAVCPTFSQNAVPYSALEGLATGCLTIASDCAAIREEPTIIRAPPEDPTGWYHALTDAHENVDEAKEFVREGLQAARQYDVRRVVDEGYLPVIEGVTRVEVE